MNGSSNRFRIALSFPGEHRQFVSAVADSLASRLGKACILYDKYHEAEFARLDLDVYLPNLYRTQSDLIVLFLCKEYATKSWCKVEWRFIRQLVLTADEDRIMLLSFDDIGAVPEIGILKGDGYALIASRTPEQIADLLIERLHGYPSSAAESASRRLQLELQAEEKSPDARSVRTVKPARGRRKKTTFAALALLAAIILGIGYVVRRIMAQPPAVDQEARKSYNTGIFYVKQRTPSSIKQSIEYFQQAVDKDPKFALAYAGLADAYNLSPIYGVYSPEYSAPKAKEAAGRALKFDPNLAEAYAALGNEKSLYEFDLPGARLAFLKALELNPNSATAHFNYANSYLSHVCNYAEAIAEMQKAKELDPDSLPINLFLAVTYGQAGEYENARKQFQETIKMFPSPTTYGYYAVWLEEMGRYRESIGELERAALASGKSSVAAHAEYTATLNAFVKDSKQGLWQKTLERSLKEREEAGTNYVPASHLAYAYARAGNEEKALEWLEKAYQNREGFAIGDAKCGPPPLKKLMESPKFAAWLKNRGLAD